VQSLLLQAFPFPSTLGRWCYTRFLWPACLFTAHMGSGSSPSPVEFSSHCRFYKFSCSWFLGGALHSCLLWPACLFTVPWGIAPLPLFGTHGTLPSLLYVFFVVVYYSVSLFSLGWGRSVQGAMLIWPRVVCGSIMCRFAHLVVCIFPSDLGAAIWRHWSPPCFSV
jgi:hypothetical protein